MDKATGSRISGGNSEYGRKQSDYYPTPPEATQALINFLGNTLEGKSVWEPACGQGHMVNVFLENGITCIGTDILTGSDFLTCQSQECDWIITNPPFCISAEFVRRCMEHNKPFALLLKSQYWCAASRLSLFETSNPTYILPLTWRPDFLFGTRGGGSPLMDVMWVVWGKERESRATTFIPLKKPKVQ